MHNVYLFQPQDASEFFGDLHYWLPYSAGCLWSYAQQYEDIKQTFRLDRIFFRKINPDRVIQTMSDPKCCGFSCYLWNEQYCLHVAKMVKQRWPDCVIIFGGPQSSAKMLQHDFVDTIVMAEGEESFVECLRLIADHKPTPKFCDKKRLSSLDVPSPYTLGLFDSLLSEHPNAFWNMTFETNRGCPFLCTFCDWGGITYSKVRSFDLDRIRQDLAWCIGRPVRYLICADANFGIFKERDLEIAKIIKEVADQSQIDSVNLQFAKNSTQVVFEIGKILGHLNRGITVSVQSMHADTLEAIKRKNLDINNIRQMMQLSEQHGVPTYTEIILGLPLETLETWKQGLADILEMGQHTNIDIWFAQLLENSEMSQSLSRYQYGLKSIMAKDYTVFKVDNDEDNWDGVQEQIEIVNATNTMTTDDLVQGYLYAWMIIQLHITGYTQQLAKYCRYRMGVSYRQYYDQLFDRVQQHASIGPHFQCVKQAVSHYLTHGDILEFGDGKKSGHALHARSYEFIWLHRAEVRDIALAVAESFGSVDPVMVTVNRHFLVDPDEQYPIRLELGFDLHSWQDGTSRYQINNTWAGGNFDFYLHRRRGLLRNTIEPI